MSDIELTNTCLVCMPSVSPFSQFLVALVDYTVYTNASSSEDTSSEGISSYIATGTTRVKQNKFN